jgi:DNA-directed RNA polymerase specialized sigma24 family protein
MVENKYSFEDKIIEINEALERKRRKWELDALASVDYDDVKQIIMTHIHRKWHLWDQSKPIRPWLHRVVANQFKNILRNYYGNYARPCLKCKFNYGGDSCGQTTSGIQCGECPLYKEWEQNKKYAYDIKLPLTIENHYHEAHSQEDKYIDLDKATKILTVEMQKKLSPKQFIAFRMLFIESHTEEDVAKYLGYKTNEKKRTAGYKQIKNLRKLFQEKATQILKNIDIC